MCSILSHIRQSLSWKLSLGILLMAMPIFMLALGILFVQSRNYVKREATKHATSVVTTTMQHINRYMNVVQTATDLTAWDVTASMQPDSLLAYSNYVVTLNGHIDGCSISLEPETFPQYGRYFSVYTVRKTDTISTVIEEEYEYFDKVWYKQPKQEGKASWAVYFDESDSLELTINGMIASYSKPLYKSDKQFVGIISTDLSLLRLSKIITTETPYADSYFMMTGDEGRYYLHPDTTLLFTHTIFSDADPHENADVIALGHQMTTGQKGSMSVIIDGKPCIVCYQPVPGTNWSLALVCPERSILQNYNLLAYILSPLIIIGLLMIFLFSSITVNHAIRPLNKLTAKLQRITNGHYDEQITRTHYNDVVGRLRNNFADMQESLNRHVGEIQQMNDEATRRNEELAYTSELAKEANHQKSLFIQNVSHQVRTPLNIIMGFAHVLKENKAFMSEDEMKSISDMMRHNALMLQRMVIMLFDCSARGSTEELYASKDEKVYCNDLAHECFESTLKHFPDLPIYFGSEVSDDFHIHTNHSYLMRSICELLYNAAKYSGGQRVVMRIRWNDNSVRFIVEDIGPGIDKEEAAHLFEMFAKVNDLTEGLGLGLALANRHIHTLGGKLFLDPSYQEGCRFIIEMPIE